MLEYHARGNLEKALRQKLRLMRKWAIQIARGYSCYTVHSEEITHMDTNSKNIVINSENNAAFIDASGIGNITTAWLAPELISQDRYILLSLPLDVRSMHDI